MVAVSADQAAIMKSVNKKTSWLVCSKLTTSLINVSLKFQTLIISEICQYFLLKKCEKAFALQKHLSFLQQKNISTFGYKVVKKLNKLTS